MAVAQYIERFERRVFGVITVVSLIAGTICSVLLVWSDVFDFNTMPFWISSIVITLLFFCTHMWLFWWTHQPFRDTMKTVALLESSSPTSARALQVSTRDTALADILTPLLAPPVTTLPQPTKLPAHQSDLLSLSLDQSMIGIVAFDAARTIMYHNAQAPVATNTGGTLRLDITHDDNEKIMHWIERRSKKAAHASHVWARIATKSLGEEERKIYDIAASFSKGLAAETILIFFDRTADYAPEEDQLDFISFAAHELRGPITVIHGYLDVLQEELSPELKKDQAALLDRLTVSTNRLSSYINNILNASKYDRRHFQVHPVETTVKAVYDTIDDDMQLRATAQNRLLSVHFPEDLPTVAADKNAVSEVFSNLIDNAIKYSNEGGHVTVTAKQAGQFVEVSVTDRGIGIPSNVLPNLFHKFYRSHRSRETVAGTGIGLYICKAIIDSHGGSVGVRSTERNGSTFTFSLPVYNSVAKDIKPGHNKNTVLVRHGSGWIRNHAMFRD